MEPRIGARVDTYTKEMLRALVDYYEATEGKQTESTLLTRLIRAEHKRIFPEEYKRGIWEQHKYSKTA